jgi:ADP-ribosylglycohydrolase
MLGLVIGDSLGAQVEFQPRHTIQARHPQGVRELRASPVWRTLAGQPTDDSELGLALARLLARNGRYDAEDAATTYARWYASEPFDCGNATRSAFAPAAAAPASKAQAARTHALRESQSNGSLMRIAPIGIRARDPDDAARMAEADSTLSHPHPVCRTACAAFAAAIAAALAGADRPGMLATALRIADAAGPDAAPVAAALRRAEAGVAPQDYQHQMGWVLIALQNAFYHLAAGTRMEPALIETVSQGGDTDTNAAITGALLGAADGRSSLPVRWVLPALTCRPDPGLHPARPRPAEYWPDDLLDLTETLLLNHRPS